MADRSGGVIRMVTKSSFDSLARVFQNTSFADEDVSTVKFHSLNVSLRFMQWRLQASRAKYRHRLLICSSDSRV